MVTDYEPTFPDIRKDFRKFKHIIEDDEELKEIFQKESVIFKCQRDEDQKILKNY